MAKNLLLEYSEELATFLSKPTKEAWYVINAPRALYVIATESRMASRASVYISSA